MKIIVIFVALLLGGSCDKSKESAEDTAKTAAEEIGVPSEKEIEKSVDDALKNKGPKWKLSYKGALSGKLEGEIVTATNIAGNTSFLGAAMTPDKKAKAVQQIQATIITRADPPMVMMTLTLADGTKCQADKGQASKVKFHDENVKTLKAELKGELTCEGGKKITYEASVDRS